jgi:hypothetical protein
MAQRPTQEIVDPLPAGVRHDLGRRTRQQPAQGLGALTLQAEEILVSWPITPSMIRRLPDAQRRSSFDHARRESSFGVAATSAPWISIHSRSHSTPENPLSARSGSVALECYEGVTYGPLVRSRRGQTESGDDALGVHHKRHLEAVDPLGLGGAACEARLAGEQPLAASPHPHDRRDHRVVSKTR